MTILGTLKGFFERLPAAASGLSSDALSGTDRVAVRRKQRMRHGFVSWPTRPAFPAQLCDISETSFNGARVEMIGEFPAPESWASGVRLYLVAENEEFDCRVAWQKGAQFGLQFQGRPQPPSRVYR